MLKGTHDNQIHLRFFFSLLLYFIMTTFSPLRGSRLWKKHAQQLIDNQARELFFGLPGEHTYLLIALEGREGSIPGGPVAPSTAGIDSVVTSWRPSESHLTLPGCSFVPLDGYLTDGTFHPGKMVKVELFGWNAMYNLYY